MKVEENIKPMDLCLEIVKDIRKVSLMGIEKALLTRWKTDLLPETAKGFFDGYKQNKIMNFSISTLLQDFYKTYLYLGNFLLMMDELLEY